MDKMCFEKFRWILSRNLFMWIIILANGMSKTDDFLKIAITNISHSITIFIDYNTGNIKNIIFDEITLIHVTNFGLCIDI